MVEYAINSIQSNQSTIFNIADVNVSYSFQCPTYNIQKRENIEKDLIISTNHFIDPPEGWDILEISNDSVENYFTEIRIIVKITFLFLHKKTMNIAAL